MMTSLERLGFEILKDRLQTVMLPKWRWLKCKRQLENYLQQNVPISKGSFVYLDCVVASE